MGAYPSDWPATAKQVKDAAGWRCIRCGIPHGPVPNVLTVHHLNGVKSDCAWLNLVALCQVCHLQIQGKVDLNRPWIFEHSEWAKPYMAGHYARFYLGLELRRPEVESRLDELLTLESQAVLGMPPLALT